jgi:hypothetical protein
VTLEQNSGQVSFTMLLIRAGNEKTAPGDPFTARGDTIQATPTARLNLFVDAGGPTLPADPGDYLRVPIVGKRTLSRVTNTALWPTTHIRIGQTSDGGTVGYVNVEGTNVRFTAASNGSNGAVRILDSDTIAARYSLKPYSGSDTRVAIGDVNGDGIPDIVTGPGSRLSAIVHVYDGVTGQLFPGPIGTFTAYAPNNFTGGLFVAVGDVDGDTFGDIVVGPDAGTMGPLVNVYSGNPARASATAPALIASFNATNSAHKGGVRVAAGNVTGDGRPEIVVGLGPGTQPVIRVFQGNTGVPVAGKLGAYPGVFAYEASQYGGVYVALGNVTGDSHLEIITGSAAQSNPARIRIFDGTTGAIWKTITVPIVGFTGGVRVGAVDYNDDGIAEILFAGGPAVDQNVYLYNATTGKQVAGTVGKFANPVAGRGAFVAGGDRTGPVTPIIGTIANVTPLHGANTTTVDFTAFGSTNPIFLPTVSIQATGPAAPGTPLPTGSIAFLGNNTYRLTLSGLLNAGAPFKVTITATDNIHSATRSFTVAPSDVAPVVGAITGLTINHPTASAVTNTFAATDADVDDHLSAASFTVTFETTAQAAFDFKQQLGLTNPGNNFNFNKRGSSEKYLNGSGGKVYFILPDGRFFQFGTTIANSTQLGQLDAKYYTNPLLILNATAASAGAVPSATAVSTGGNNYHLAITGTGNLAGIFQATVFVTDNHVAVRKFFLLNVVDIAPAFGTITVAQTAPNAVINFAVNDTDDTLTTANVTATVVTVAQEAFDLKTQLGLTSFKINSHGLNEKDFGGAGGLSYYILSDGRFFKWGGSAAASTQIGRLNAGYYTNPNLLLTATAPASAPPLTTLLAGSEPNFTLTVNDFSSYTGGLVVEIVVTDAILTSQRWLLLNVTS